jgi:Zn-dependent protease with chaperone function
VHAFAAELMDGSSADVRNVLVALIAERLEVRTAAGLDAIAWSLAGLRIDPLTEGVLHFTHPDHPGALLSSSDERLRDALVRAGAIPPRRGARTWLLHGTFYAAAIAGAVALFVATLPALSAAIARRVPPTIEEQLAFPVHKFLESRYCRTKASREVLDGLSQRLRLADDPVLPGARVEILDLPIVNALTFPGGSIVVTSALVEQAQDPDELAGVLAHELEHVARRHIMTQIVRSAILTAGWHLTAGDFAGLMAIDPSTTMEIASRSFSRDAEREADQGALERLHGAAISSNGLSRFFARIERQTDSVPEWLSTHPASAVRSKMTSEAEPDGKPFAPALSAKEWRTLKQACRARTPLGSANEQEAR